MNVLTGVSSLIADLRRAHASDCCGRNWGLQWTLQLCWWSVPTSLSQSCSGEPALEFGPKLCLRCVIRVRWQLEQLLVLGNAVPSELLTQRRPSAGTHLLVRDHSHGVRDRLGPNGRCQRHLLDVHRVVEGHLEVHVPGWSNCQPGCWGNHPSLSGSLCARHSMTQRSMNATQDEDRYGGPGGAAADSS